MPSKYDDYWIGKLDVILELIREAEEKGVSRNIDVSDIVEYGERKSWYGDVVVSNKEIVKGEMAHAKALGKILLENKMISGKFRFVITSNLKLRVEKLDSAATKRAETLEPQNKLSQSHPVSTILSEISVDVWNIIVQEEPEWKFMLELFERYEFGKFAVLMTAAGLNDFQLRRRAEVAYWPEIAKLLKSHKTPDSLNELRLIMAEFYAKERLPELKLRRLNRFLSSKLAEWLWNSSPKEIAENFVRIWYELALTMKQERDEKTIAFAMKCLGIALLMAGESRFSFENIPIPVDYRVREFTKKLGISITGDEDVRTFWNRVLKEVRRGGVQINMIHLDSLIWQIGVLSESEIVDYFSRLGLGEVGERIVGGGKMKLCVVPCGSRKIWDESPEAGPTKARDVYTGPFAKTCIEYAEMFYPDSYVILSAKHGFLFPDEIIPENYNVTFKDPKTNPIGVDELRKQAEKKGLMKYDEIIVVAGKDYVDIVKKVFAGKKIVTPLKGLGGMGLMMSAMKRALAEEKEIFRMVSMFEPPNKIKIGEIKRSKPVKPYAKMDGYGRTETYVVSAEIGDELRKFTVFEFLDENPESLAYVLSGYSNRLQDTKSKDFYYDQHGVFFSAWGISWKKNSRHKFDEDEVKKIAELTGLNYTYHPDKKSFVFYFNPRKEPIMLESRPNEDLLKKLILGWFACLEWL